MSSRAQGHTRSEALAWPEAPLLSLPLSLLTDHLSPVDSPVVPPSLIFSLYYPDHCSVPPSLSPLPRRSSPLLTGSLCLLSDQPPHYLFMTNLITNRITLLSYLSKLWLDPVALLHKTLRGSHSLIGREKSNSSAWHSRPSPIFPNNLSCLTVSFHAACSRPIV